MKLLPGVSRTMFRLEGGDWVAREVVANIKSGRAKFIVNTGDLVWWGKQGSKPSDNPYWKLVNEDLLKQLPKPDKEMTYAGLPGRVFPAVGNHEVWADSDVEGLLAAFPYLTKFGVSDKQLIYKFDYQESSLHLPLDWRVRLPRPDGVGLDPSPLRSADRADAELVG